MPDASKRIPVSWPAAGGGVEGVDEVAGVVEMLDRSVPDTDEDIAEIECRS